MKKGPFGIYGGFGGTYLIILAAGAGSFLFFWILELDFLKKVAFFG